MGGGRKNKEAQNKKKVTKYGRNKVLTCRKERWNSSSYIFWSGKWRDVQLENTHSYLPPYKLQKADTKDKDMENFTARHHRFWELMLLIQPTYSFTKFWKHTDHFPDKTPKAVNNKSRILKK